MKPRPGKGPPQKLPPAAILAQRALDLVQSGDRTAAEDLFRQALRIDPRLAGAWQGLGVEAFRKGKYEEAHKCFQKGIAGADFILRALPHDRPSLVARAGCYYALYQTVEAAQSARLALDLAPDPSLHRTLLCLMNFLPDATPEAKYDEARRWDSLYAAPLAPAIRPHTNSRLPDRRLRLGYLSPDLNSHAIMKFLQPVLEHHDRSQFEVSAYSVGTKVDECTLRAQTAVEHFVAFGGEGAELAERIRLDQIDILVDLAGHTMAWEFLRTLALKPAPVQVSWMGLLSTTGMSTMDYFIGDAIMPCPGTEHLFTETVYRLPRVCCCYRPLEGVPVAPSPCLRRGYITFGCFNQPTKITRDVVRLWSAILRAVPQSCLMMKFNGLDSEVLQGRFRSWFAKEGVSRDRLQFAGGSEPAAYLASYGEIDIALDPFPYNGGSTTLDTLWMGVPMVTLAGRTAVQRCGASILTALGLTDMVTESPEMYVRAALFLSELVGKIPDLRQNVRKAFLASPFMDEIGLVRSVEAAFRDMWRRWSRSEDSRQSRKAG